MTSTPATLSSARAVATAHHPQAPLGLMYGIFAYSCWGVIPIFFKAVKHLPPVFVLGHRIIWAFAFFLLLVACQRNLTQLLPALRSRRTIGMLFVSALLVASNWGVFIYAVANNRVLDSSLGYFIAPLVVVALGGIVLHERFRTWQLAAIVLAITGVAVMTIAHGHLPWIGLALALTFGAYGLFRKTVQVDPVVGLCVETALLIPVGILMIVMESDRAGPLMPHDFRLLLLSGPVTAIPLLLFTGAARRLRLSTIGLLQYIGPTGQFLLAVFAYREPFGATTLAGFALIWLALVLYSIDSVRAYRHATKSVVVDPVVK